MNYKKFYLFTLMSLLLCFHGRLVTTYANNTPDNNNRIEIESLMRKINAKINFKTRSNKYGDNWKQWTNGKWTNDGDFYYWPGGKPNEYKPAIRMPFDGYYGENLDPEFAVQLMNNIVNVFYGTSNIAPLYSGFIKNSETIAGIENSDSANIIYYQQSDFPYNYVSDSGLSVNLQSITTENYRSAFTAMMDYVSRLTHVIDTKNFGVVRRKSQRRHHSSDIPIKPGYSTFSGVNLAQDWWDADTLSCYLFAIDENGNYTSVGLSAMVNALIAANHDGEVIDINPDGVGASAFFDAVGSSGYMDITIHEGHYGFTFDHSYQGNLSDIINPYAKVYVFFKCGGYFSDYGWSSPWNPLGVPYDEKFHRFGCETVTGEHILNGYEVSFDNLKMPSPATTDFQLNVTDNCFELCNGPSAWVSAAIGLCISEPEFREFQEGDKLIIQPENADIEINSDGEKVYCLKSESSNNSTNLLFLAQVNGLPEYIPSNALQQKFGNVVYVLSGSAVNRLTFTSSNGTVLEPNSDGSYTWTDATLEMMPHSIKEIKSNINECNIKFSTQCGSLVFDQIKVSGETQ